jgi:polar amino acid transport system permease protein
MSSTDEAHTLRRELLWSLVLAVGCAGLVYGVFSAVEYRWRWQEIWGYRWLILQGWWLTILVSISAILLTIVVAFLLMLGQRAPIMPLRLFCRGCVEMLRGTPLLVLLLLGYYGVAPRRTAYRPGGSTHRSS